MAPFEQLAPFDQLADLYSGLYFPHPDFVYFREKKQNEKISHENEGKNRRPKRAPIVRGAKVGANYAEYGNVFELFRPEFSTAACMKAAEDDPSSR